MSVLKKIRIFDQRGQGVLEYLILSSLIGIFCLVAIKQFGEAIKTRVNNLKDQVHKNIKIYQ